MVKLVVFDWNGTLLADFQAVLEGVEQELKVLGLPPMTAAAYRQHYDTPLVNFYKSIGVSAEEFEAKHMAIAKAFHAYYEPRVAKAHTRQGARKTLQFLKKQGIACVIVSNHTMEGIYFQLERLKLTDYFDAVLANEGIGLNHYEGKQARVHHYLRDNNFLPSQTAIIGDTIEEVRIGRNLGLKTVALTGGYNSITRLRKAEPDVLIHKLPDIVNVIKEEA
jgi:phosphoglycolate phosphatase